MEKYVKNKIRQKLDNRHRYYVHRKLKSRSLWVKIRPSLHYFS